MSSTDEEYILRWNDHGVSFFNLAEDLLSQDLLTDVTVWCGDRVFEAHRLVLCACSPLFRSMLTLSPKRHVDPIVFLKDISPVHFERLLQFMYCGEARVPNCDLQALLETATVLKIRGLANEKKEKPPAPPPKKRARVLSAQAQQHAGQHVEHQAQAPRGALKRSPEPPLLHSHSHNSGNCGKKSPLATVDHNTQQPLELTRNSVLYKRPELDPKSPDEQEPEDLTSSSSNVHVKEEEEMAVSPPPQSEMVALVSEVNNKSNAIHGSRSASGSSTTAPSSGGGTPRILPPSEPRKTGTCYFCKKAFMKNKQLMNHVCPKRPRGQNSAISGLSSLPRDGAGNNHHSLEKSLLLRRK